MPLFRLGLNNSQRITPDEVIVRSWLRLKNLS